MLSCILVSFLTAFSVKAQSLSQDICGVYKMVTAQRSEPLQITHIEKDIYWILYGYGEGHDEVIIQAFNSTENEGALEFIPLLKIENQASIIYKNGELTVQDAHARSLYKKFELPDALSSLFDPDKVIRYQLYETQGPEPSEFTDNYFSVQSNFQVSFHHFKNGVERCKFYFMIVDSSESMTIGEEGIRVNVRACTFVSKEDSAGCDTFVVSNSYKQEHIEENYEGTLFFNKEGNLMAFLSVAYRDGALFVNKYFSIQDVLEVIDSVK